MQSTNTTTCRKLIAHEEHELILCNVSRFVQPILLNCSTIFRSCFWRKPSYIREGDLKISQPQRGVQFIVIHLLNQSISLHLRLFIVAAEFVLSLFSQLSNDRFEIKYRAEGISFEGKKQRCGRGITMYRATALTCTPFTINPGKSGLIILMVV